MKQRRDANEAEIIDALRAAGAYVIQMDKSAGFDLLVAYDGTYYVVEVKQPGKQALLTRAEFDRHDDLITQLCDYNIVTTPEEALAVIGR